MIRSALLFTCLLFATAVSARELVVGVENIDYKPIYSTAGGQYQGFARELLDAFASAKGYTLVYRPLPVKRLFSDFFAGNLDLKYPDNPLWSAPDRQGLTIHYSDVTLVAVDGVMVKADRPQGQALKRLVTIRGFTPWVYQDAIKSGAISVQEVNDLESALRAVMVGRADGAYCNVVVARERMKADGNEGALVFDRKLPFANADFTLSSVSHPDVISEFNDFLQTNSSLIDALKKRSMVEAN